MWIEAELSKTENMVIGVIYRHPSNKKEERVNFEDKLINTIKSLNNNKMKYIIGGDINIDLLKNYS